MCIQHRTPLVGMFGRMGFVFICVLLFSIGFFFRILDYLEKEPVAARDSRSEDSSSALGGTGGDEQQQQTNSASVLKYAQE